MSDNKTCKSCQMPMAEEKDFGTNVDGSLNEEYCVYCMKDGKITLTCQSCGMPMKEDSDFGIEADGSKSQDYCHYCYDDGKFTTDSTMEEMIEMCADIDWGVKNEDGTPVTREQKVEFMRQSFPTLKRWSGQA